MLGVIFLTRLSMGIQFQSIASVAPLLVNDLHIGYGQVGWLMGLFMLPGAAIAYPGGMLGRRFGERRLVLLGLALMTLGGLTTAASEGFALAAAGRVASGTGGVLLNVMLTKMVADWFVGREISTAMSIMLTSWPVGIGLALATLGTLAGATSWRVALYLTVIATAIAFVLILSLYRDPPPREAAAAGRSSLVSREIGLSVLAGLVWGIFNASYVVFLSFAPGFLVEGGTSVGAAGAVTSLAIWVTLVSVPLGGLLADRLKRPDVLTVVGSLLAMGALLAFPHTGAPALSCFLIGRPRGCPARRGDGAPAQGAAARRARQRARHLLLGVLPRDDGGAGAGGHAPRSNRERGGAYRVRGRAHHGAHPGARRLPARARAAG